MITDLDSWLHELESEDLFAVSNLQPSRPINVIDLSNDHDSPSTERRARDETVAPSENDEAGPSSMAPSALSGGSTTTSASLLNLNCSSFSLEGASSAVVDEEALPAFDLDNLLNSLEDLEFRDEENFESLVDSVESHFSGSNDLTQRSSSIGTGRRSAEDGKCFAFQTPVMEALSDIYQPCNQLCHLNGFCTKPISGNAILELRKKYFRGPGKEAPKDKERALLIMDFIRNTKCDDGNNLTFVIDGYNVCTPAFLRILGVSSSTDMTKAPGQWTRLIKGFINKSGDDALLSKDAMKLDSEEEFTMKRGHVKAYCNEVAQYFCDYLPTVASEDGSTNAQQVPYGTIKSFFVNMYITVMPSIFQRRLVHLIKHL
jgi:hypothetical protein